MQRFPSRASGWERGHKRVPTSAANLAGAVGSTGHAGTPRDGNLSFDAALRRRDLQQCINLVKSKYPDSSDRSSGSRGSARQGYLDSRRHSTFIEACFLARQPELALEYVELLPPESKLFNLLLRACGKHRNVALLRQIEAARQTAGIHPDSYSQAALITAYSVNGRQQDAVQVFHQSWHLPTCRTLPVCNAAIAAFSSIGDWIGAKQVGNSVH